MIIYLDFDGVLFDTISVIKSLIKKNNINLHEDCQCFFENLDWNYILNNAIELCDSVNTVKKLCMEYNVKILTHVSSENEIKQKKIFIDKSFNNIETIFVSKKINKNDYVDATGNILIDDSYKNVDAWNKSGGKGILFDGRNLIDLVEERYYV